MYSTAAKVSELDHFTRLNKEFRSDLYWWHIFLSEWNGASFLQLTDYIPYPEATIQTESLWIMGVWCIRRGQVAAMAVAIKLGANSHYGKGASTNCAQLRCLGPHNCTQEDQVPT